jgi:hypothetical protein
LLRDDDLEYVVKGPAEERTVVAGERHLIGCKAHMTVKSDHKMKVLDLIS